MTTAIGREMAQRERLNRELEIAREVQEHLFPQRLPPAAGLDYCEGSRPAREVGGDYYDFLELPDGRLGIAIGDVSGKGVGAALMMASLEASLRALASVVQDPADLLGRVNRLVCQASSTNLYATLFYAEYDPATRRLAYVNAGHNPPVVLRNCDEWPLIAPETPMIFVIGPLLDPRPLPYRPLPRPELSSPKLRSVRRGSRFGNK